MNFGTRVYGASDDLIEFEGDFTGEVGFYGSSREEPCFLALSDGTMLSVWYGKNDKGIWAIDVLEKGDLLIGVEQCTDEDAKIYSDVANFLPGIEWAYHAKGCGRVS